MTTDFEYRVDSIFVRLLPNNEQADTVWREIQEHFSDCVIPLTAWSNVRAQIKAAGYTVRKARPVKMTNDQVDDLLKELLD